MKRDEAERALADLNLTDAARRDEWSALAARFGWRSSANLAEAEAVLSHWEGLSAPLADRETARRRLADLREDNRSFETRIGEVEAVLFGLAGTEDDGATSTPETVVRRLEDGLAAEKTTLARHAEAKRAVESASEEMNEGRAALDAVDAAVAGFLRLHGLEAESDCVSLGQRAAAARHLRAAIAQRRVDMLDAGEGLSEPVLRAEVATMQPGCVAAEVTALGELEESLVDAGQLAVQNWAAADLSLAQIRSKLGGIDAQGRGQAAALAFGGRAERWLVLATAQAIMTRAVERYRAQNQHPLIARAGELMAELTRNHANPIGKLSAEYRDKKRVTLLGIRRDGSPCEIANMTEGTRDQLFLGLRIAAIERYSHAREGLPFVADDLFITSDDERTECGLQALAALARTTQVILFTHHRSVLQSAEGLAASHGTRTHQLAG